MNLFVTFGAALEKLRIARDVQRNRRRLGLGSSLTTAGITLLALAVWTRLLNRPIDPSFPDYLEWSRWLLAGGIVLLLARMGLWFHLGRVNGILLAFAGISACANGAALVAGARLDADPAWHEPITAVFRHHPGKWNIGWRWTDVAPWLVLLGLLLTALREGFVAAVPEANRNAHGGPDPRKDWRELPAWIAWPFNPTSPFGNLLAAVAMIIALFCLARGSRELVDGIVVLASAGLAFCFASVPVPVPKIGEPGADAFRLRDREGAMRWLNYWAPADLVPDHGLAQERENAP